MSGSKTVEAKSSTRNGVKRLIFAAVAILFEVVWMYMLFTRLNRNFGWISTLTSVLALLLVLTIYGQHKTSSMKMPWIILIMAFPMFGVFLYLMTGLSGTSASMRRRYQKVDERLFPLLPQNDDVIEEVAQLSPGTANVARYIKNYAHYPMYNNSDIEFYKDAADGLEAQKKALKKAEKFIFMEYHAIEDKESFAGLHEILKEKAAAGLDVRLFYDDMGSIGFINTDFVKKMEADGIQCRVFNPMSPMFNMFLNNRDHRKITVIDGRVGFTGGYNLANEYFNITSPYGHWKDTGVKITGAAVKNLTITFLEMWNAVNKKDKDDDQFDQFVPEVDYTPHEKTYVMPYADSPMDHEQVGENVYISLINAAEKYIYFITPYLIITDEMTYAFGMAAKRGVDVRIITPGIPDKKMIYSVTRSYYGQLAMNGVRIFEYTPGFCHAKQCVSDDRVAACGTINLDYRSLYHHFENGCLFAECEAVHDMKKDFDETFPLCNEVTEKYATGRSTVLRIGQCFLRLFSPLM